MTDIEISQNTKLNNIIDVAKNLNLNEKDLVLYGDYKAKIKPIKGEQKAKLILVTAITPTKYGEGKTTVSIGLADALFKLKKNPVLVLRQPSMGPVFGLKGGATGGGYSQVTPMEDINLHFTGDFHAITAANNLLCSAIDNHIFQGNNLDIQEVNFHRALDVNDRALREVSLENRKESFSITAASEIMALFCLASSLEDLKERLGNIVIGYNSKKEMIYAKDLNIEGALTVILKDAFMPNLVQTLEHTPTIIHGGPFANIAHGCNSIIATKTGLSLGDYVVTEAGFGADLGAEKFLDIKCRVAGINPDCIVLVATIKALKHHGEGDLTKGLCNLERHINNMKKYNVPVVVCLNKYNDDTEQEISIVKDYCANNNVPFEVSTAYIDGSKGAEDLAKMVIENTNLKVNFKLLYEDNLAIKEKIEKVSKEIYGAEEINYSDTALNKIKYLEKNNKSSLPICIAKTQYSFSDDAKKLGAPSNYEVYVRDINLYNGAGFITVLLGNIMTMPGLPKKPNYEAITLDEDDNIKGIF